jgi:hypothetical protein
VIDDHEGAAPNSFEGMDDFNGQHTTHAPVRGGVTYGYKVVSDLWGAQLLLKNLILFGVLVELQCVMAQLFRQ